MEKIKIVNDKSRWDDFLKRISTYDFYDTFDYHVICSESQNGKPSLLVYENGSELLLWPFLSRKITQMPPYQDITSVYGYSNFLTSNILNPKKVALDILEFLRKENFISIFTRINPLNKINEVTHHLGEIVYLGKTVPVYVKNSTMEEQFSNYRKSTRYDIKKILNQNITCEHDKNLFYINDFINIYHDTMKNIMASDFYFFPKEYFKELLASHDFDARLYVCLKQNILVCGGIFVFCNGVVQYHLSGTQKNYYNLSPNKLMIDKVLMDARKESMNVVHLGGGLGAQEDSLFKFKSGFSKETLSFYLLKSIINNDIYEELSQKSIISNKNINQNFFPKYRAISN